TNNAISVSGQQLTNINGDLGGNLQVLTGNTTQALQNLSEVANQVTSAFQGLPTSITGLTGTLQVPPAAAGGADIAIPGVTELVSSNGAQYSASLAYRSLGAASNAYQLVISKLVPIGNAPAVTNNGYVAATGTGGYVVGTVTFPPGALAAGTQPQSFAGQQIQLVPTVANTQPGTIGPVTAFTTGLTEAAASAPNNVTSNNTLTLFTQTNSQIPNTTIKFGGTLSAAPVFPGDTAQSAAFTITTDLGNQYTATAVYRPTSNNTGWQVVINSLVPIGSAPAVGNLNYNGAASTGGIVIGGFDPSTSPPTFLSTDQIAGIPTSSSAPSQFPGHIEPIEFDSTSTIAIGAVAAPVVSAVTQNVTAPYYSGDIEVNPNISLRALQVGDQFAGTAADTNGGAAAAAASALVNNQFTFTTAGIAGTQTLEVGAGQSTINVGQDLTNANNQITTLNTANTQITQAIAPQSEVNLDTQMSQLVVLQNLYQANARVVTTANQLLDTLVNLVQ
ncbi:MAG TPA: flagellar basal body rod C-terminal domain-containing protein, partial [Candidatus Sulfotelmatobacter sp.]|nr:flagellar basal body rod C-terminal domain-containing protein [Candidatus Sulfotelmatobacter sp.]